MNNLSSYKVFILGAHDLEMLTIKQLLDEREDCMVLDHHLQWDNSLLSAYSSELQLWSHNDIYGIELQEDIIAPNNYHRIDHHNDWNWKSSSLEQVAELLEVKLNRHQQLVAANDKGYIPAMQAMNASKEEIENIRKMDRMAQGVSQEDEDLAIEAIEKNMSTRGSLILVKASSSSFSPICDRLFPYKRLLVYTDSEWTFYGEGKKQLVSLFSDEIENNRIYHGGGDKGYIGATKNAFSAEEIHHFINLISHSL